MREIRFRGISLDTGKYVYGGFVHSVPMSSFAGIVDDDGIVHEINLQPPAQLIGRDGDGEDIYEGDALNVFIDALTKAASVGLIAYNIKATRPKDENAVLRFYWDRGRFELYWTTRNGKVDTGLDWRVVCAYAEFFEVIKEI